MSITVKPLDQTTALDRAYFNQAKAIQNRSQSICIIPVTSAFDELLGHTAPTWAMFEAPPGHPPIRMFLCGICPDIDFTSILKHPTETLLSLYLLITHLNRLLNYTTAKMTFSKG